MTDSNRVLAEVRYWIDAVVIDLDLCPFAARSIAAEGLRISICDATDESVIADSIIAELNHLESSAGGLLDSTLIVLPTAFPDFLEFNDFLEIAETIVDTAGYTGTYQVASFHPQYRFAGEAADGIGNFTNRSPYPIVHLLRESSVSRAVDSHPDPESIPSRNIARLETLGIAELKRRLSSG